VSTLRVPRLFGQQTSAQTPLAEAAEVAKSLPEFHAHTFLDDFAGIAGIAITLTVIVLGIYVCCHFLL
jgi:hypothetical protein